ncbi:glycoside hydrolase superfamily [Mycena metata]|uniref:beta-mannosidase n=1 Tax=Mycena metata TaxID=1033252 RepID=A0AAD7I3K0_9AGAR|nr:glycoside hydrolase superfamily [Mycena metata]
MSVFRRGRVVSVNENINREFDQETIKGLQPFPKKHTVTYLTTAVQVNIALQSIQHGQVGFDTEFTERKPTAREQIIIDYFPNAPASRKTAITGLQITELHSAAKFDVAWDNIGLRLIQIAYGNDAWVIDVRAIKSVPVELRRLLESPHIAKVGVGLIKDLAVIWDDLRMEMKNLVDVGMMARLVTAEKHPKIAYGNMGLKTSVEEILGFELDKEKALSDWAATRLTDEQIEYAALDAVASLRLHEVLTEAVARKALENGAKILAADNMFQTHIVPLELSSLKQQNTLLLHFKSALLLAKELEAQMGVAQYDWRWDWGPELMTCGPYRPITLKTYTARIKDVQAHALLSAANAPSLTVDVTLDGSPSAGSSFRITLASLDGKVLKTADVAASTSVIGGAVSWDLSGVVEPWWPVGYGAQPLYNVSVSLVYIPASSSWQQQSQAEAILDEKTTRVGFRRVALIQEPLAEADQYGTGTTFLFEVNGVRIFMGVPADNLLTTISPERYRAWLTLLRDGNQNMVRLWGGGVYEPDVFYDTCDELGILVWQDFQFACGVYPAHEAFVASVRKEAEDNVRRLRHHPSLALFCGNNEDYQMVLQWGDVKDFPAIKIYEEVLPDVVSALTGPHAPIPYHRGSPYGGKGWDTADPTVGDGHQWNVWGGKEFPWQDYVKLGGRTRPPSEFGIPSHPEMKMIEYWMDGAGAEARHAQSALMAQHCRAGSFERRLAILMNEGFRVTEDLETYVYNTRLMAAEAVGYAYQVWRRKWGGRGKEYTAGVLVWQLNDCWPVTSWAIADYFLRPKPVYFTIKRQLETYSVGIMRTVRKNRANDRPPQYYEYGNFQSYGATLEIWGTNSSLTPRAATLELHCVDLKSRWTHTETHAVTLLPNQATELLALPCPGPPQDVATAPPTGDAQFTSTHSVVVGARLLDGHGDGETGKVLARYADWPQPYRFIEPALLSQPGLDVKIDRATGEVRVSAERPVKGLWLSATSDDEKEGKEEVKWSDNALDVMPGDPQVVFVHGLGEREVGASWLGREKVQPL